jgi:FtsH-binding integral membrane protein
VVFTFILERLNPTVAGVLFFLFCALTGAVFSIVVAAFAWRDIALAFASAVGLFVVMVGLAYTTSIDLTRYGPYFLFAFLGLMVAGLVNLVFIQSSLAARIGSVVAIGLFSLMAMYNAQVVKRRIEQNPGDFSFPIYGAFMLYLSFITLFLSILRFVGGSIRRRPPV